MHSWICSLTRRHAPLQWNDAILALASISQGFDLHCIAVLSVAFVAALHIVYYIWLGDERMRCWYLGRTKKSC